MTGPLNLASRPFRNEALPALVFGLSAAALLGATLHHGFVLKRLLSSQASALRQEVVRLEAESEALRARGRALAVVRTDKAALARWTLVKDLVDRRLFSWTDLLRRLEQVAPPGVRLTALTPEVQRGRVRLTLTATVRSPEDGLAFTRALEEREEFSGVYPLRAFDRDDGAEFQVAMEFRAPLAPEASAKGAAARPDGQSDQAADEPLPADEEPVDEAPPVDEVKEPE
jgi:Tfp pilus assembly protein PilN